MRDVGDDVHIEDVKVKLATDKALLCIIDGDEVWIPRSQIVEDSEVSEKDDEGTLVIRRWLAEEKGLV